MPAYVMEGVPYRPEVALWLDHGSGLVRASQVGRPPLAAETIEQSLRDAIASPLAGTPGRPARIRVATASLAASARAVLGAGIPVEIAPTPEIDELAALMAASFPVEPADGRDGVEPSYLEDGLIAVESIAAMFRAAHDLWREAPWKRMPDDAVFAVDVPALGLHGACLSVIGLAGEHLGFVLFDSIHGYEAFLAAADEAQEEIWPGSQSRSPLSGYLLSLSFERKRGLTATMRREVEAHGWMVAGARAYPLLMCLDADGVPRPHGEREVALARACASALARFAAQHRSLLDAPPTNPKAEHYTAGPGPIPELEVVLTFPHPRALAIDPPEARLPDRPEAGGASGTPERVRVGRNDPCPCGSGKKHKRCHGGGREAPAGGREASADGRPASADAANAAGPRPASVHELDAKLVKETLRFAGSELGLSWQRRFEQVHEMRDAAGALAAPWFLFHTRIDGATVVDQFLAGRRHYLTDEERAWLEAQRRAWLSVWEVVEVSSADAVLTVRDVLTGEQRSVCDVGAAQSLGRLDSLLGRVVDHGGLHLFCGVHHRVLRPSDAAEVVAQVRDRLRLRSKAVAPERLRAEDAVKALIAAWHATVEAAQDRLRGLVMRNAHGDPVLLTEDHFVFEELHVAEVVRRLGTIAGCAESDDHRSRGGSETRTFVIGREAGESSLGLDRIIAAFISLGDGKLRVRTNSIERADEIRAEIERAASEIVKHRGRVHVDPRAHLDFEDESPDPSKSAHSRTRRGRASSEEAPPEIQAAVRAHKERYYADWPDLPLPALGGATPRQAAANRRGRKRLALLLRDMEHMETGVPPEQRFDFARLRGALGLEN